MKPDLGTRLVTAAIMLLLATTFVCYAIGDAPRRSLLKETLSLLTLSSFALVLGQFHLTRCNPVVEGQIQPRRLQWLHKAIAYGALSVLLLHPVLIVLPRYFEAGVRPQDAFITMLTTFDNLGTVLGLAAWVVMIALGLTSLFRLRLMKHFALRYRTWRYIHAGLASGFVGLALWHAIDIGRHTDLVMSGLFIVLAVTGIGLLARRYHGELPRHAPTPQGAKT